MKYYNHLIHGYAFEGTSPIPPDFDHLFLVAPLQADAGRWIPSVLNDLTTYPIWKDRPEKKGTKKIAHLLSDIDEAEKTAKNAIVDCDLERAVACLEPFNSLWVGIFAFEDAERILEEIGAYQKRHKIPNGYVAYSITAEVGYLNIWYDR